MERCNCAKEITSICGIFQTAGCCILDLYSSVANIDQIAIYIGDVVRHLIKLEVTRACYCRGCKKEVFSIEEIKAIKNIIKYSSNFNEDLILYIKTVWPDTIASSVAVREIFKLFSKGK